MASKILSYGTDDIKSLDLPDLKGVLNRYKKIVHNRTMLNRLKDKGEKIEQYCQKLMKEINRREIGVATKNLESLSINNLTEEIDMTNNKEIPIQQLNRFSLKPLTIPDLLEALDSDDEMEMVDGDNIITEDVNELEAEDTENKKKDVCMDSEIAQSPLKTPYAEALRPFSGRTAKLLPMDENLGILKDYLARQREMTIQKPNEQLAELNEEYLQYYNNFEYDE